MEHVLPAHRRLARRGARLGPGIARVLRTLRKPSPLHLALAAALAALLAGGFLWFRGSSFVSVTSVQVSGVAGVDAGPIEAALTRAARRQSTMSASVGALEAAVAPFHVVRAIAISTSFPHTMRIDVLEQLPVAVLSGAGSTSAVAADGVVLGGTLASSWLPRISAAAVPAAGETVHGARVREYLTLLGAAPAPLLPLVEQLFVGKEGLTARMRGGLLVYFGDAARPHAKWASLAAVLANPESHGATYVDVRLPQRPAAGIGGYTSSGGGEVSASDPTSAALAESLARAVNGEAPIETTSAFSSGAESGEASAGAEASGSGEATEPSGAGEVTEGGEAYPGQAPTEAGEAGGQASGEAESSAGGSSEYLEGETPTG